MKVISWSYYKTSKSSSPLAEGANGWHLGGIFFFFYIFTQLTVADRKVPGALKGTIVKILADLRTS